MAKPYISPTRLLPLHSGVFAEQVEPSSCAFMITPGKKLSCYIEDWPRHPAVFHVDYKYVFY